jgi:hypothetical protein
MITYISLSSDKKYLSIDIDTESKLKIHLEGDVIMKKYDNKTEYIITETKCRIILIQDLIYSTEDCIIGDMEIHSDGMTFIDRYEDGSDCSMESLLSEAIDLYKQEMVI